MAISHADPRLFKYIRLLVIALGCGVALDVAAADAPSSAAGTARGTTPVGCAAVKQLVLSHRMLRTLGRESESLTAIRASYSGPVTFADDLQCFRVSP